MRLRPAFLRATLLLSSLFFILSACAAPQPAPYKPAPTITRLPIATDPPTATPVVLTNPVTGGEIPDITGLIGTPQPVPTFYDPINATLIAQRLTSTAAPTPKIPDPAPVKQPEPVATGKLSGAMLGLIPTPQGLWAMRPDGSSFTLLTTDPIDHLAVSPGGRMAAYVTHDDPTAAAYEQPFGYSLKIITLYDDQIFTITPLDPPGLSAASSRAELDNAFQTLLAYDGRGMAWSPDGMTLAFVSSRDGPAGDIFLYTPSNGKLRRLTKLDTSNPNGPLHAYGLRWSPYGQQLFYKGAYSFGSGTDAWLAGAWVTSLNGAVMQVAQGEQSGDERLIDWQVGGLLMSSRVGGCPNQNLRVVSTTTGETKVLWPGCYTDMLYNDRLREALISITPASANPETNSQPGLYLVTQDNPGKSRAIAAEGFDTLFAGDYRAAWYGFNPGMGMFTIQRDGSSKPLISAGTGGTEDASVGPLLKPLTRLPDGTTWLFTGSPAGLFVVKNGGAPALIFDGEVKNFTGSPAYYGRFFFFAQDEQGALHLYGLRAADWKPYIIDSHIPLPTSIVWTQ